MTLADLDATTAAALPLDRAARTELAATIRRFLDEQITNFAFDEALLEQFVGSSDPTVRFVASEAWFYYDDYVEHLAALSKPAWDYFQRLLLVLESDRQVVVTRQRHWSWTQGLAAAALVEFAMVVGKFGWGRHLLVFSIPFGLRSVLIWRTNARNRRPGAYDEILTPFASFTELSATYWSTPGFAKQRCPRTIASRRAGSRLAEFGMKLKLGVMWLIFAPVPLLFQTLPRTETRTRVLAA